MMIVLILLISLGFICVCLLIKLLKFLWVFKKWFKNEDVIVIKVINGFRVVINELLVILVRNDKIDMLFVFVCIICFVDSDSMYENINSKINIINNKLVCFRIVFDFILVLLL